MLSIQNWRRLLTLILLTAFGSAPVSAANVLFLEGGFGTGVQDDLTARGHALTEIEYDDWDGTNPAPDGFDIVVMTMGEDYGEELGENISPTASDQAYQALIDYIQAGGVFFFTEWVAYDMGEDSYKLALDPIVPFDYTTYDDYDYGGSYQVIASSPLTKDLPNTWSTYATENDGGVCFTAPLRSGARILMTREFVAPTTDCPGIQPALVESSVGSGRVIWFNSDLAHEDDLVALPEHLQVISNAVDFSVVFAQATNVPALPLPLLGTLSLLLGYFAHRGLKRTSA